ncbi:hypothetical protein NY78_2169 [Desulfovibrio sp. TomC]|nr:hypothetical protein NY78_2169 [Desulfovibrio sp. TomC]
MPPRRAARADAPAPVAQSGRGRVGSGIAGRPADAARDAGERRTGGGKAWV